MAKCDEGYRCEVCGRDVEAVTDSDLYLRFVLGEAHASLAIFGASAAQATDRGARVAARARARPPPRT